MNPKNSGTVSPSDSQSNWLNITKTNWTHILFPFHSMWFHLHRNITPPTFDLHLVSALQMSRTNWFRPLDATATADAAFHLAQTPFCSATSGPPNQIFFFLPLPVGFIYVRRENPLRPQSFQTRAKDSGQKWAATHSWTWWGRRECCTSPLQSHVGDWVYSQDASLEKMKKKMPVCYFNQSTFICKALNHIQRRLNLRSAQSKERGATNPLCVLFIFIYFLKIPRCCRSGGSSSRSSRNTLGESGDVRGCAIGEWEIALDANLHTNQSMYIYIYIYI